MSPVKAFVSRKLSNEALSMKKKFIFRKVSICYDIISEKTNMFQSMRSILGTQRCHAIVNDLTRFFINHHCATGWKLLHP